LPVVPTEISAKGEIDDHEFPHPHPWPGGIHVDLLLDVIRVFPK